MSSIFLSYFQKKDIILFRSRVRIRFITKKIIPIHNLSKKARLK